MANPRPHANEHQASGFCGAPSLSFAAAFNSTLLSRQTMLYLLQLATLGCLPSCLPAPTYLKAELSDEALAGLEQLGGQPLRPRVRYAPSPELLGTLPSCRQHTSSFFFPTTVVDCEARSTSPLSYPCAPESPERPYWSFELGSLREPFHPFSWGEQRPWSTVQRDNVASTSSIRNGTIQWANGPSHLSPPQVTPAATGPKKTQGVKRGPKT